MSGKGPHLTIAQQLKWIPYGNQTQRSKKHMGSKKYVGSSKVSNVYVVETAVNKQHSTQLQLTWAAATYIFSSLKAAALRGPIPQHLNADLDSKLTQQIQLSQYTGSQDSLTCSYSSLCGSLTQVSFHVGSMFKAITVTLEAIAVLHGNQQQFKGSHPTAVHGQPTNT